MENKIMKVNVREDVYESISLIARVRGQTIKVTLEHALTEWVSMMQKEDPEIADAVRAILDIRERMERASKK